MADEEERLLLLPTGEVPPLDRPGREFQVRAEPRIVLSRDRPDIEYAEHRDRGRQWKQHALLVDVGIWPPSRTPCR